MKKTIMRKAIDRHIKSQGIVMYKKTQNASYGFFFSSDAVYDRRTVHSIKQLNKLANEGFSIDTDLSYFLFAALYNFEEA